MRYICAVEISFYRNIEIALRKRAQLRSHHALDFLGRPDEELSFLALAVGILGRVEAVLGTGHFAEHIVENLARDAEELGLVQRASRVKVEPRQQRVVVEHFFEMWNQPSIVDAVAMEPAADLIVDSPARHLPKALPHHLAHPLIAVTTVPPTK